MQIICNRYAEEYVKYAQYVKKYAKSIGTNYDQNMWKICRICTKICIICHVNKILQHVTNMTKNMQNMQKICKSKKIYTEYALPTLLMRHGRTRTGTVLHASAWITRL
jgi:hypothetical protein